MIIGSQGDRFALERVPAIESGERFDDRGFRVTVQCRAFSARVDEIMIAGQDWIGFAKELRALERTRRGEASVSSIDPTVFTIRIYSWDSAGHLALEGHVGKYHGAEHGLALQQLRFAMDVPSDQLDALVAAAESVAA